jgi:hypothetical protein
MYFTNYYILYIMVCLGYTAQRCWAIGNLNQQYQNKLFLEKHDFENYYVGGRPFYRPIPKIPEYDYAELEALYFIFFYEYEDVKYIVIRRR